MRIDLRQLRGLRAEVLLHGTDRSRSSPASAGAANPICCARSTKNICFPPAWPRTGSSASSWTSRGTFTIATPWALITDGRFSGGSRGAAIGHVSPEAAAGGPIAIVKDGDEIEIDIDKGILNLNISQEEEEKRKKELKDFVPTAEGYLGRYQSHVSSADLGAYYIDEK